MAPRGGEGRLGDQLVHTLRAASRPAGRASAALPVGKRNPFLWPMTDRSREARRALKSRRVRARPRRSRPHRQHAAGARDAPRHRAVRAVPQARVAESRRLDQGPHRPVDDRGRGARRPPRARRRVVEATAGNTGLGLALVARAKGYRVVLVVPDKMSTEKVLHLKALGAEVHVTRSDVGKGHPAYYQDLRGAARPRDPRRVLRRPVQQPGQSARARDDHRPGDLGADGARRRRDRLRRRLGRHDRPG